MREIRTSAQVFRAFADGEAVGTLHAPVALALARSARAMGALATFPPRRRHPRLMLAALHDLALAGRVPALAAAYGAGDGAAAGAAAVQALLDHAVELAQIAGRRRIRTDLSGHGGILYAAVAAAAQRSGAAAVGLIDVGPSAGLNLHLDRVGVHYSNGQSLGNSASAVQISAALVGHRSLPPLALPEVVARILVGSDLLDVTDGADVRWLRACLRPDQPAERASLDAEVRLAAATSPPEVLPGNADELLPAALARVPAGALAVVITTWTLSRMPAPRRLQFRRRLQDAGRPVAWVSAEGVGVAPGMPTLGDRPASGHSILGLTLFDGSGVHVEVLGRCWSRGSTLSCLADG